MLLARTPYNSNSNNNLNFGTTRRGFLQTLGILGAGTVAVAAYSPAEAMNLIADTFSSTSSTAKGTSKVQALSFSKISPDVIESNKAEAKMLKTHISSVALGIYKGLKKIS